MANYYNPEVLQKFFDIQHEYDARAKNGEFLQLSVSMKNGKMGFVASVSLPAFLTCPDICKTTCAAECYAAKLANLRETVRNSYARNFSILKYDPARYWSTINAYAKTVRFFRWHVSGDIVNADYFAHMVEIARENPSTVFLAFTKRFAIVNAWIDENGSIPENFHVMFSAWGDMIPENPHGLPMTNVYSKKENLPAGWTACNGTCEKCFVNGCGCIGAKTGDVIGFKKH